MSDDGRMPEAAVTARHAAQQARELAEFLDEFAEHLAAPDHAALVSELSELITTRMHSLRKVIRVAREKKS
jgi:CHASE3 domain sensor protein